MSVKLHLFYVFILLISKIKGPDLISKRNQDSLDEILHGKCQNITVELCKDVGYPQTIMPNLRGNKNQAEAQEDLRRYWQLVSSQCSPHLKLFVCSLYVPICTSLEDALPPCRSLCLLARNGCESSLKELGPFDAFACENYHDLQPCVEKDSGVGVERNGGVRPEGTVVFDPPPEFHTPRELGYEIVLGPGTAVRDCGIPCNDTRLFLGAERQNEVRLVLGFFACFCFLSSLLTVATFAVDSQRFVYPQRPFAFMSACHAVVCLVYVVGFSMRGSVACLETTSGGFPFPRIAVAVQGLHSGLCVATFSALYYFQMACHLWWVGLNLALLMSACLKWSQEAISMNAKYFHLAAWLLPGIQLVAVLTTARLDGDPTVGTCLLQEPEHSKLFLFSPLVFFAVIGAFCWAASLVGLSRVRATMRNERGIGQGKLDSFMLKVGVFGLLYLIPTLVYLCCIFYEQSKREEWLTGWFFDACVDCPEAGSSSPPPRASFHLVKNLSLLSAGLSSGLWIWNRKICSSWGKLIGAARN